MQAGVFLDNCRDFDAEGDHQKFQKNVLNYGYATLTYIFEFYTSVEKYKAGYQISHRNHHMNTILR